MIRNSCSQWSSQADPVPSLDCYDQPSWSPGDWRHRDQRRETERIWTSSKPGRLTIAAFRHRAAALGLAVAGNDLENVANKTNTSSNSTITKIDNDTITKTEIDLEDSYNQDIDVRDSNNTHDIDITVNVAISNAFKEINHSYNQNNDWRELDGLKFDVMNVVGEGVLSGSGNDAMFNLSQVSELDAPRFLRHLRW